MLTIRKSLFIPAALVMVAAPGFASAQIAKSGASYNFKPKFTKGSNVKYTMNMDLAGAPQGQTKMAMSFSQKVVAVKGHLVDIEVTSNPMLINGKPMGQGQKPTVTKMQWDTKANKAVGNGAGAVTGLPSKPLKVGESYTATFGMASAGAPPITANYKFVGIKNVAGKQVAQFDVTIPKQAQMPGTGTGTMYLLMADCSLLKANINMNMTGPAGQNGKPQTMTMKMTINRA
jgi:hypothetical protein